MLSIRTLCCILILPTLARAYMVPAAMPLDDLIKEAPVICKVTAISSDEVGDDSFRKLGGWAVFSTRLRVITVLKGEGVAEEIEFRHYDHDPKFNGGYMYAPQHYRFEQGAHYILFAKPTNKAGIYRPLWDSHRSREDQGRLNAADNAAIEGKDVRAAIWNELTKQLKSDQPAQIVYAIRQLNAMSGAASAYDSTKDFARPDVLKLIAPLIEHARADVASAAISAVAGRSPYHDGVNMGWLATVGKGKLLGRGHGTYADKWDNPDARAELTRLLNVADKGATAALRAQAIRAMGLCKDESILKQLSNWCADTAPEIRSAAAQLWADFPSPEAERELSRLASDTDATVRRSVAVAIAYSQSREMLPVLTTLLKDKNEAIRTAAGISLISFEAKDAADILKTFVKEPDFHATFVNALALDDPKPWLDDLAEIVSNNLEPKLHLVSQMPVYTSWQILKADMESRPATELASGKLDKYLDALDVPPNIGSGPFQEMYRMYREKGLNDRAAQFRVKAKKRISGYDIDYFFKQIDASPR
jgi:HEAT repeat protein